MHIADLHFCFCFFFGDGFLVRKSIDNVDFAAGIVETIAKIAVTGARETFDRAERARGRVMRPEAACGEAAFIAAACVCVCARGDLLGAPCAARREARRAGARCAGARRAARRVGGAPGHAEPGRAAWRLVEMPRSTLGALLCASGAARDASEGGAPKCENLCRSGDLTTLWCCGALKVRKTVFGPRAGRIARSGICREVRCPQYDRASSA